MSILTNLPEPKPIMVVDWQKVVLQLRSAGVPTSSIWQKHNLHHGFIERMLYNPGLGPRHWVGELVIQEWLAAGGTRENLPKEILSRGQRTRK